MWKLLAFIFDRLAKQKATSTSPFVNIPETPIANTAILNDVKWLGITVPGCADAVISSLL